jgi:hypothetical protein
MALTSAEKASLVERRQRGRNIQWAAAASAAWDAENDKKWAKRTLARFEQEVKDRIPDLLEGWSAIGSERARHLTMNLVAALRTASANVFEAVVRAADPSKLTGIDLDLPAADAYLREHVKDKALADALMAMARAALHPEDEFGAELTHLIVTGQVLQGMLSHRDLKAPTPVAGSMLVLDTSTLLYRLEGAPQPRLLNEFLQASTEIDCRVVVTRSVINEWSLLWSTAAEGAERLANPSTGLPSGIGHRAGNPVLRSWLAGADADDDRAQTWTEFHRKYHDIENWLTARQVQIIEDGQAAAHLVEQMRRKLTELSDAAPTPMRTPSAARTDAYSAALVAEARERNAAPVPQAWFIAKDQLTDKAYAVRPEDGFPATSAVEAWLILLSASRSYDPAKTCNLAEIISDSAILNSFLTVSASYGLDELLKISELLNEVPGDPEELAEAVRADFIALAESMGKDIPAEIVRRRTMHRDRQAWRMAEQVREEAERLREERASLDSLADKRKEDAGRLKTDNERLTKQVRLMLRGYCLSAALLIFAVGIVISTFMGAYLWLVLAAAVGWVAIALEGTKWLTNTATSAPVFVLGVGATIAWTVLACALGIALAPSANAHSLREPRPGSVRTTPYRPSSRQGSLKGFRGSGSSPALRAGSRGKAP